MEYAQTKEGRTLILEKDEDLFCCGLLCRETNKRSQWYFCDALNRPYCYRCVHKKESPCTTQLEHIDYFIDKIKRKK